MNCDLLIKNAKIADGSGGDLFEGSIAIVGDRIVDVYQGRKYNATKVIDAAGHLVTPGFVDIHTHYDGQVTWDSRLLPSSHHGVTTVITGNCGVGFAPCRPQDRARLIELMEGVEDIPEVVLSEGLPWTWETFEEYLETIASSAFDADVGVMVPHAALRVFVMGERAVRREPATSEDMAEMAALTRRAMLAGAIGFGTSRSLNHRTLKGELIPTVSAAREELLAIAGALGDLGKGVIQIVLEEFESRAALESTFSLLRELARHSGRPLSFSLNQKYSDPDGWRRLLQLTDEANADGLKIRAQVMGRPIGALLGHEVTLNPFVTCPTYASLAGLAFEEKIARLQEPGVRAAILKEFEVLAPTSFEARFERMYPLDDPPDYEPALDTAILAQAQARNIAPAEFTYDLLLEDGGRKLILAMALGYASGSLAPSFEMMKNPNTVLGLGDGGAHCGVVCDASHTTSMLTLWTRDRTRGPRLGIAEAVRMLAFDPARAVGLHDRGLIKAGMLADLNIIDYADLRLHRPTVAYDLPAGGRRLHQEAQGYIATIKSGQVTYSHGRATQALPGRLIRGAGQHRVN